MAEKHFLIIRIADNQDGLPTERLVNAEAIFQFVPVKTTTGEKVRAIFMNGENPIIENSYEDIIDQLALNPEYSKKDRTPADEQIIESRMRERQQQQGPGGGQGGGAIQLPRR
jgi:hypothetical protein